MFQSPILDVAAGLVLVFLAVSLVCTSINEYISQALSLRAEVMFEAVQSLFQNCGYGGAKKMAQKIYDHDLVDALSPPNANPSYIPSQLFSLALVDTLGLHTSVAIAEKPVTSVKALLDQAKSANDKLEQGDSAKIDERVFQTLSPLAVAAGNGLDQFRKNIESWFDNAMQRATGSYKRKLQIITILVALAIALVFNVDTLMVSNTLWSNPTMRTALAGAAAPLVTTPPAPNSPPASPPPISSPAWNQARTQLAGIVGWSGPILPSMPGYNPTDPRRFPDGFGAWIGKLFGLLITAFAASLGAPFWFGVLSKIVSIRSSGTSPVDPKTAQPGRITSTGGN